MRRNELLDLIFPPACGGCLKRGTRWCAACAASLQPCPAASLAGVPLIAAARLAGPLQRAIHTYKYRGRPALARSLAVPLVAAIRRANPALQALTFVPLHPARRHERGFNQAELLARELGAALSLPVASGLTRVRATRPQVGLTATERESNLRDAFCWTGPAPPPLQAGVVDDVCTTGATLVAAGEALEAAGGSVTAYLALAVPHTLALPLVTLP